MYLDFMRELEEEGCYIVKYEFMWSKLGLKKTELDVYAVIYGFEKSSVGGYKGTREYIAKTIGCDIKTVTNALKKLVEKNYIYRHEYRNEKRMIRCDYRINLKVLHEINKGIDYEKPREKTSLGNETKGKNFPRSREKTSPDNTIYNSNIITNGLLRDNSSQNYVDDEQKNNSNFDFELLRKMVYKSCRELDYDELSLDVFNFFKYYCESYSYYMNRNHSFFSQDDVDYYVETLMDYKMKGCFSGKADMFTNEFEDIEDMNRVVDAFFHRNTKYKEISIFLDSDAFYYSWCHSNNLDEETGLYF